MATPASARLPRAILIGLIAMATLWLIAIVVILSPLQPGIISAIAVVIIALGLTVTTMTVVMLVRGTRPGLAILCLIASVLLNPLLYLAIAAIVAGPAFFDLPNQQ